MTKGDNDDETIDNAADSNAVYAEDLRKMTMMIMLHERACVCLCEVDFQWFGVD